LYQIDGRDLLFDWLARQTDADRRLAMLDWLAGLASDPLGQAQRVPGVLAPVYMAVAPLRPPAVVTFLLAEQFRTLKLIRIRSLP
jgi:hypothetical protein